jgi:RHS repeat-associated protein
LRYTPAANYFGNDSLIYTVSDGRGGSAQGTISLIIDPVNDPPTVSLSADLQSGTAPLEVAFTASAADVDGDTLQYAWDFGDRVIVPAAAASSITHRYTTEGNYTAQVTVSDGRAPITANLVIAVSSVINPDLPPDPVSVAPAHNLSIVTDFYDSVAFLFNGTPPIQTGVVSGTITRDAIAVLRGQALDSSGQPVSGVVISLLDHPEYGQTKTRADGMFDFAVNGGKTWTVQYQRDGYLPVQRQIEAVVRDYAWLPDVKLTALDPAVTTIQPGSSQMQVARSSVVADADGTRQVTLLFPAGVTATLELADGSTQTVNAMNVRATEFTVGVNGRQSMPGELPPNSGYTYAAEFSLDEALAAGATNVEFSKPLPVYIDNFIGFPVGGIVPVGYYDREKAAWVPSENGKVIKIVAIENGRAALDITGDDLADDASSLGVDDTELQRLATLYPVGKELWRVLMKHFTPWDCNWPYGPPDDAGDPNGDPPDDDDNPDCQNNRSGSIIGCEGQTLGELLDLAGTPFGLRYGSERAADRITARTLRIPLSGATVPPSLVSIRREITIAGRQFVDVFPATPNQISTFVWDGLDSYKRPLQGRQKAEVRIGYNYQAVYREPAVFAASFARFSGSGRAITGSRAANQVTIWRTWKLSVGGLTSAGQDIGGWNLDVHHTYDPADQTMYSGDGTKRSTTDTYTTIATAAGGGQLTPGDNAPATAAPLYSPNDVALGPDGSLYIADLNNQRVRRVAPNGTITTLAGNGSTGFSGDGGPATSAAMRNPSGVLVGNDGTVYIADRENDRIRAVAPTGQITTIAGGGTNIAGDGGTSTSAPLYYPNDISVGPDGSYYIADQYNHRIRKVAPDGTISTVVGTGTAGYSGDGGNALSAQIYYPSGVVVTNDGTLYISDDSNKRIRKVNPSGIITTLVGGGNPTTGDGGVATSSPLNSPYDIAVGPDGSVYIADRSNQRIRKVAPDNTITTVAGTGDFGFTGDTGAASSARLYNPSGIAVTNDGTLYIADDSNNRIRVVNPAGQINTLAGGGSATPGDGAPATAAPLAAPNDVSIGPDGSLYIADRSNQRVRKVAPDGTMTTIAGTGAFGFSGDTNAATAAQLYNPSGVLVTANNTIYIADENNNRIRVINPAGQINTLAGGGAATAGDGAPATAAPLGSPRDVAIGPDGSLYIADRSNHRIRRVAPDRTISTVAGSGTAGFAGDSGQATSAQLNYPSGVAVASDGTIFVADTYNHRIRKIAPNGVISTVAGNGNAGFAGDSGQATSARLYYPIDVVVASDGSLYIADQYNHRIRKVASDGTISTVAGNGTAGSDGDGSAATSAELYYPESVLVVGSTIYIADSYNHKVRRVASNGTISTFAGTGTAGFSGDTGQATAATLRYPQGLVALGDGSILIGDSSNHRVRRVAANGVISTFAGSANAGSAGNGGAATSASLSSPIGLAVDTSGLVFIADSSNHRIQRVALNNTITTVAGTHSSGYTSFGDGKPADLAQLRGPTDVATGPDGAIYIADTDHHRIRRINVDGTITTVAGNGVAGSQGDGDQAIYASLYYPSGVSVDASGNLYIADRYNHRVRKVAPNGIISTLAGTGVSGLSGDSGNATAAQLHYPYAVLALADGSVLISDQYNHRVRKVATNGTISTLAGTTSGFAGDGQAAVSARLTYPIGLAADSAGRIFVADSSNHRVRRIGGDGKITTVAGTNASGFTSFGDGRQANLAQLDNPRDVALGPDGSLYIAEYGRHRVRRIQPNGTITTVAGNGVSGYQGDGDLAIYASLSYPSGVVITSDGTLYIADSYNHRVRKVASNGIISTIAGTGESGLNGDGGLGTLAQLSYPYGVAVTGDGSVLISDQYNHRIRRVAPDGVISTLAGTVSGFTGDGGAASSARMNYPLGLALDSAGQVLVADSSNQRIRRINTTGRITTIAGTNASGFVGIGDGLLASQAKIQDPQDVAYGADGSLYFADQGNHRVRRIKPDGTITTVAGNGVGGYQGDGDLAIYASLYNPSDVSVASDGTLYIADQYNHRVRKVAPNGVISTLAGTGENGFSGDGALALAAKLSYPDGVQLLSDGSVLIVDTSNDRVRSVGTDGIIATVAGSTGGFAGDGGNATAARLSNPRGITVDAAGRIYVADYSNQRIRRFTLGSTITTIAGVASAGFNGIGDGYAATLARLNTPADLARGPDGSLYIADSDQHRIRRIKPDGTITTVAGNGVATYQGDGDLARYASLYDPSGVAVTSDGTLYIADRYNHRIRKVTPDGIISTVAGTGTSGLSGDGGLATAAQLSYPHEVDLASDGSLIVTDSYNHRVRRIAPDGIITTVAGSNYGFGGDGGPATAARLTYPAGIAIGPNGLFYIADTSNHRIRRVNAAGVIITVAGTSQVGFNGIGDGGQATNAYMDNPTSVLPTADGSVYVVDSQQHRVRRIRPDGTIVTIAGNGTAGFSGDGELAIYAQLYYPKNVALAPDGGLLIADSYNQRIRRVSPDGVITTIVGGGQGSPNEEESGPGSNGDGGPANLALLAYPNDVAVAADGTIYIADTSNNRVRVVSPDGLITTLAGGGACCNRGDNGPASQSWLSSPTGVGLAPDGTLYIADQNDDRIRRVTPDGRITTVAGTGSYGFAGDGGLATAARLAYPADVSVGRDGALYIADQYNNRIRRVGQDGIISSIVGNGEYDFIGDGGYSSAASMRYPTSVAESPDGILYIADTRNERIRRVKSSLPGVNFGEILLPSADSRELYLFDSLGRHLRTLDGLTNATLYTFAYDTSGRLSSVTDRSGLITRIERNAAGASTAIVGPFGHRTSLAVNSNGYLTELINPAGERTAFEYTSGGLLTKLTNPRGGVHSYEYDSQGRLIRDSNPVGGVTTLARVDSTNGYTVTVTNGLNHTTHYGLSRLPNGDTRRVVVAPNGAVMQTVASRDGKRVMTLPNGNRVTLITGPDPRWGTNVPYIQSLTIQTPNQRVFYSMIATATVELADPTNPLSLLRDSRGVTINGKRTVVTYVAASRTLVTVDPAGLRTEQLLDEQGREIRRAISNLAPTTFVYNSFGQLVSQSEVDGATTRVTTMAYNDQGDLTTYTDALGAQTTFSYDAVGRRTVQGLPTGQQLRYSYDAAGNLVSETNAQGIVTTYEYDLQNRRTAHVVDPTGRAVRTEYRYDVADNLLQRSEDVGNGRLNLSTSFAYLPINGDGEYRVSQTTNPLSQISQTSYNSLGQPISMTDPLGHTTAMTYTAEGWLGGVTSPLGLRTITTYNNDGQPTSITDPRGSQTRFSYDPAGRVATVTAGATALGAQPAINQTTRYGYDLNGRVIQLTHANGQVTNRSFDGFGRLVQETDPAGNQTNYTYDLLDRVLSWSKGSNTPTQAARITYAYDAAGRLVSETNDANGLNLTTTYRYTRNGSNDTWNLQEVIAPRGNLTAYRYNIYGQQDQVIDALSGTWNYNYDNLGRQIGMTDPLGRTTTIGVDALGRQTELNEAGRIERWGYNADGTMASYTDLGGRVTRYEYDIDQRLTKVDFPAGTADATYTYDASSNVTAITDGLGGTTYGYDVLNRLIERTRNGRTVSYAYNQNDRVTRIGYWSRGAVDYGYDNADRVNRLTPWGGTATTYAWRSDDQLASITRGNGVTSAYSYDSANRLTRLLHQNSSSTINDIQYALDSNNNRTQQIDSAGTTTYQYDALNRLTNVSYPTINAGPIATSHQFSYDAVGNRTQLSESQPATTTSFGYDAANRITSPGYSYDAAGNLLSDGTTSYEYDGANRLVRTVRAGITTTYGYDGWGNLVQQAVEQGGNTVTTEYILDERNDLPVILGEVRSDGVERLYAYGPEGFAAQQSYAGASNQGIAYPLLDGLGSVRNLADASGAVILTRHYDAFGNLRAASGSGQTILGFAGELSNPVDGSIFLRARHYQPALGRFLERDTFAGLLAHPTTLNRYPYAENNPVNYTDPSGHLAFIPILLGAWAIAEVGMTLYGAYDAARTFMDPCASGWDKALAAAGTAADLLLPGGGYGAGARGARNAANAADAAADARRAADNLGDAARRTCSFSADTLVSTDQGLVAISKLEEDDQVLAYNEQLQATDFYSVTVAYSSEHHVLTNLRIAGEELETAPEHPFFVLLRGWVAAGNINTGESVRRADGSYGEVEALEHEVRTARMYNLTVAEAHTFFVGDGQWLVHNACNIGDNVTRLPNDEIIPPTRRGNAPTSAQDGKPIEIHHEGQSADGPFREMHRTDHRGGDNYARNHQNTGQEPSQIDRGQWNRDRRTYWEQEWDSGRWP